mmetsp:Transcript_69490/g.192306  ORF Transcript_69490/g.192306 Transcript_69490/m.192306 type:complete len:246 (+) Transcript_69490:364-1101(+)
MPARQEQHVLRSRIANHAVALALVFEAVDALGLERGRALPPKGQLAEHLRTPRAAGVAAAEPHEGDLPAGLGHRSALHLTKLVRRSSPCHHNNGQRHHCSVVCGLALLKPSCADIEGELRRVKQVASWGNVALRKPGRQKKIPRLRYILPRCEDALAVLPSEGAGGQSIAQLLHLQEGACGLVCRCRRPWPGAPHPASTAISTAPVSCGLTAVPAPSATAPSTGRVGADLGAKLSSLDKLIARRD